MITTAIHSEPIDLGRQGENLARTIEIDISAWRAEYGEGTVQLLHQRPGDSAPYPAAVEQVGDVVRWAITAADTARVGYGAAQLLFYAGDVLAKQCIYRTYVSPSLGQSAGEPPEAQQPWVERVLAEAAKVTGMTARAVELPAGADPTADYADGVLVIGIPPGPQGETGQQGRDGDKGEPGAVFTPSVSSEGVLSWSNNGGLSNPESVSIRGPQGPQGEKGDTGATGATGPQGPKGDTGSPGPKGDAFTYADFTVEQLAALKGPKGDTGETGPQGPKGPQGEKGDTGAQGAQGETGPAGADGKSAYQYAQDGGYTGTEAEFAAKLAEEMPDKLPNPNALTFTGAVTGSYDGSAPVSVEIPSGGGGKEWELVIDTTLDEDSAIDIGNMPNATEMMLLYAAPNTPDGAVSSATLTRAFGVQIYYMALTHDIYGTAGYIHATKIGGTAVAFFSFTNTSSTSPIINTVPRINANVCTFRSDNPGDKPLVMPALPAGTKIIIYVR